jgi:organic radical activating enzyme
VKEFKIQSDNYNKFDIKITLKPSFKCNQCCWFCSEYDNNSHEWSYDDCNKVLNKLKLLINETHKNIFIYFYGGEPTLNKNWEYLTYELIKIFHDKKLFIQTQTNLSLSIKRLQIFLTEIKKIKKDNHHIELCSSFHPFKQNFKLFIKKLSELKKNNCLGYCFFSTDLSNEEELLNNFKTLIGLFPDKIKLRFTELNFSSKIPNNYPIKFNKEQDHNLEYLYLIQKYPFLLQYTEEEFSFIMDNHYYTFNEILFNNYNSFRLMKCECYTKNLVIDNNLKCYHCNDDFKNNINKFDLDDLDNNFFKSGFCLNKKCYDGLEFKKWK